MFKVQRRIGKKAVQDMSFPNKDDALYSCKHEMYREMRKPYTPADTSSRWPEYFEIPLNYLWNILNILRFKYKYNSKRRTPL